MNLGSIQYFAAEYEDAASSHRRATELNPMLAYPWVSLGVNLGELGRIEEAVTAVEQGLQKAPRDWWSTQWYAATLLRSGDRQNAAKAYYRVLELAPRQLLEAHVRLGVIEWAAGQHESAHEHMRAALAAVSTATETREHPSDADMVELEALALLLLGRNGAIATLDRALDTKTRLGPFDSVRLGVYDILSTSDVEGLSNSARGCFNRRRAEREAETARICPASPCN